MEAVSFQHYLTTQTLITYEEARGKLPRGISLAEDDYVLGLFDLVGELMRFAITAMATDGAIPRDQNTKSEGRNVLVDLRELRMCFEALDTTSSSGTGSPFKREVEKKMEVMKTCVEKVERAVYGMIVRGRERPTGWVPDLGGHERGVEFVESY